MAAYGSDLRIVLLGKTGSGKSAAGNTMLGKEEFTVVMSSKSVTRKCQKYESTEFGSKISVVDTPGLFDTEMTEDKLKSTIEQCVELSVPGPHVFLLVIRLGVRFTAEERNTVEWIQKNFGEEASKYTIILFTYADVLKTVTIEQYIGDDEHLKQLVAEFEGRYHLFNNEDMKNRSQVRELLKKMNALSSTYYTNKMYQAVQKRLEEEEEKKRKEEEEKRKQWEEKIRAEERKKFEEENQELKDKCEKLEEEIQRKKEEELKREEERKQYKKENLELMERCKMLEEKKTTLEYAKDLVICFFSLIVNKTTERAKQVVIGAGAGAAVGGVVLGVAFKVGTALVATAAPAALILGTVVGAGVGCVMDKYKQNKERKKNKMS